MITLNDAHTTGPELHRVSRDPGSAWEKAADWAIDAAPDDDPRPDPVAKWDPVAIRTGICGAVSPRVISLAEGGFRLYYTQIIPHPDFPAGGVDYDHASTRVLSAVSADGVMWKPEAGVRLSSEEGGAGAFRVVSSEVVPIPNTSGHLRMYYECCGGPQSGASTILSARSEDGGIQWIREAGVRWGNGVSNFAAPRIQFLAGGLIRLFCYERGLGIVSALSEDGGVTFIAEPGVRIRQDGPWDSQAAFAPEILQIADGDLVMYYAGYSASNRAQILRAHSKDGLLWREEPNPVIAPNGRGWDAVKCSEMAVFPLPGTEGEGLRFRILYEGCDGTSAGERGVWRIAAAETVS